jgi:LmbE family N-acetylglucosaminyl deacetylase
VVKTEALAQSRWSKARWLVLAPHPDDETLGAGALISHTAAAGTLAAVAYLTDGTGSHPEGTRGLAAARRAEARKAIHRLSGRTIPIEWIGWKDAHPHGEGSAAFDRDVKHLAALMRRQRIDAIAVTDISESHCDHVAAYRLAFAASRSARRSISLFTYHVWSEDLLRPARRLRTRPLAQGVRRLALQAHRSQLSSIYGEGFRLPIDQWRMPSFDVLTLQGIRA